MEDRYKSDDIQVLHLSIYDLERCQEPSTASRQASNQPAGHLVVRSYGPYGAAYVSIHVAVTHIIWVTATCYPYHMGDCYMDAFGRKHIVLLWLLWYQYIFPCSVERIRFTTVEYWFQDHHDDWIIKNAHRSCVMTWFVNGLWLLSYVLEHNST